MFNKIGLLLVRCGISLLKGGDTMSVVYASLIVKGIKTFAQVPEKQKEAVHNYLFALDLDDNGNPLV
jgi:hypothetical protein